jgi:hypothetical protein
MIRLSYHLEYIAVKYGLNIRGCPNFLLASVAHMKHYKSWNWLYHWGTLHVVEGWLSLIQSLLGFVAHNPTYILSVLFRNVKPNNGRFHNRTKSFFKFSNAEQTSRTAPRHLF